MVATPIIDVVRHYGTVKAVSDRPTAADFRDRYRGCAAARTPAATVGWNEVDDLLADASWDGIWSRMTALMIAPRETGVVTSSQARIRLAGRGVIGMTGTHTHYDVTIIVGAGFAGSVLAERLRVDRPQRVLLLDRRPHIARQRV